MPEMMTGARYLAEALAGQGVSHVFFVDAILRRALIELEALGVVRVLAHAEKAAVYMADGYARVSGRVGVCMAQSVGAANLAAGLQDPFLARSPVLALTGRKAASFQHRNAYQEIDHAPLFAATTKWTARIEDPQQLALLLPQAFRTATTGSPRPVHLDLAGLQGEIVEAAGFAAPPPSQPRFAAAPAFRPLPDSADIAAAAGLTADKPLSIRVLALGDGPQATKLKLMEVADTKPRTGDVEFIHSHTGFRYLTLLVTDMEATLARLKQAGVKPLGKSPVPLPAELLPPGGFFLTVVRDPDGNLVELIGK